MALLDIMKVKAKERVGKESEGGGKGRKEGAAGNVREKEMKVR